MQWWFSEAGERKLGSCGSICIEFQSCKRKKMYGYLLYNNIRRVNTTAKIRKGKFIL